MHRLLRRLNHSRREETAILHTCEQRIEILAVRQWPGEDVGRGNGVLHREIDAYAANRRHGVSRVTDRQQTEPPPGFEAVEGDCQQLDLLPVLQRIDRV